MSLKKIAKKIIPGVSWHNPVVSVGLRALDPIDYLARVAMNLHYLPRYSVRVRSNGITKQFGGMKFARYGQLLAGLLQEYASLDNDSYILEIGCGCGRTALALTHILNDRNYVGMDINKMSLDACKRNHRLLDKNFNFDLCDVYNSVYNPNGRNKADVYTFAYSDNTFDVVFLVSVFTHMLSGGVKNYIKQIGRCLKPGGTCMISTFLMDYGTESKGISFPYHDGEHYCQNRSIPERAVGYYLDFYIREFGSQNMRLSRDPLFGSWRNNSVVKSSSGFPQDILLFLKRS